MRREFFEFRPRQGHRKMQRSGGTDRYERQVNIRFQDAAKFLLRFSAASFRRCMAILSLLKSTPFPTEFLDHIIHHYMVEIIAAETVIPGGGNDFKRSVREI